MAEFFNRHFNHLDKRYLQELNTLETEGVIYNYLWGEGDETEPVYTRLRLTPVELIDYVDAAFAYDEFQRLYEGTGDPELALRQLSDGRIRKRVEEYNAWTIDQGQPETAFCLAAFLGEDLEGLLCGIVSGRHEVLTQSYSGDRRYLLREILEMFPQAVTQLKTRMGNRPPYAVEEEQDVRDLLYTVIKCIFPDARLEEYTSKHADGTKRIDIVIPSIETLIEVKYLRTAAHGKSVADELKIDFESYHVHPHCKTVIAFVWDANSYIKDRSNFIRDLRGLRMKGTNRFNVELIVKP